LDLTPKIISYPNTLTKILQEIVTKENVTSIGFEHTDVTVAEIKRFKKIKAKFLPIFLDKIREMKFESEIKKISKACSIGDKIFSYILNNIKEGMSEEEVAKLMEIEMLMQKSRPSFPTIVAFGKNAATPHHISGKDKLTKNQFVLLDFGAIFEGYCSDMTRTVYFGKPSKEEIEAYDTVKEAQKKAIQLIENSRKIEASKVDKIARDFILSKGFDNFQHGLGHGIGIDVHESPSLSPFSKDVISNGMVFSIEPGIYINDKFGIRIEDLFVALNNSIIQLTNSSRELINI